MNDPDNNTYVFVVGWLGFNYPMGVFGTVEEILTKVVNHPSWIFFYGPRELSDVAW